MRQTFIILLSSVILSSCAVQREQRMFLPSENEQLLSASELLDNRRSFTIEAFDILEVKVANKNGEILIDPEFQMVSGAKPGDVSNNIDYKVSESGIINMPMINEIKVLGLTVEEAEEIIFKEFEAKYDQPFIQVRIMNKRAVLLRPGSSQVVQLIDEKFTLAELLASSINTELEKANAIRLIRDKKTYFIDLSSTSGAEYASINILPNDIIYLEPVIPTTGEKLRNITPLVGILSGLATITALIFSTTR